MHFFTSILCSLGIVCVHIASRLGLRAFFTTGRSRCHHRERQPRRCGSKIYYIGGIPQGRGVRRGRSAGPRSHPRKSGAGRRKPIGRGRSPSAGIVLFCIVLRGGWVGVVCTAVLSRGWGTWVGCWVSFECRRALRTRVRMQRLLYFCGSNMQLYLWSVVVFNASVVPSCWCSKYFSLLPAPKTTL